MFTNGEIRIQPVLGDVAYCVFFTGLRGSFLWEEVEEKAEKV